MSDFKSLLTLAAELQVRDQPFIDTIKTDLIVLIDATTLAEIEYKVEYDINTTLLSTDGPLQVTRIQNNVLNSLRVKGYRTFISVTDLSPIDPMLVITWKLAELSKAPL